MSAAPKTSAKAAAAPAAAAPKAAAAAPKAAAAASAAPKKVKAPKAPKTAKKGSKVAAKDAGAKAARKFTIDCREPVNDEILDTSHFVRLVLRSVDHSCRRNR